MTRSAAPRPLVPVQDFKDGQREILKSNEE